MLSQPTHESAEPAPESSETPPRGAGSAPRGLAPATVVARAQQGDIASFEQLVRHYSDAIMRLAVRMVGNRAEAEDIVQDCFVTVWRRLPTLEDPQAFHAWLYHLATRQCLNVIRARSRRPAVATEPEQLQRTGGPSPEPGPEAQSSTNAQLAALDQALRALPEDLRACWVLKELHELTYDEVGYALGIPASTVRGRLARARETLAKGMAAWR